MSTDDDSLQAGAEAPETLQEQGAESATDTGADLEKDPADVSSEEGSTGAPAGEENNDPANFTKRMHKKTFEVNQERRGRLAAEAEVNRLLQQVPEETRPVVPPLPDQYADNFDGLMQQRDQLIADAAAFDARQEAAQTRTREQGQQRVVEQQQALATTVQTYAERAGKLNISAQELQVAGQTVAAYGISDQLTQFILMDEQGPQITTYLAKNPEEIETLKGMDPMRAAAHIATNVKTKAAAAPPTGGDPPPPADTLGGGGAPPGERGPKGAKYE